MERTFPSTLSLLRRESGLTQRQAAVIFGISQGLLSHYENGMREPGLEFVRRACEVYGVSADYLLCLTEDRRGGKKADYSSLETLANRLSALAGEAANLVKELEE